MILRDHGAMPRAEGGGAARPGSKEGRGNEEGGDGEAIGATPTDRANGWLLPVCVVEVDDSATIVRPRRKRVRRCGQHRGREP